MADTLTLHIDDNTADRLRRLAEEMGESIESLAVRLLAESAVDAESADNSRLSEEQRADLRNRLQNPGPRATPERVANVLAKFGIHS